MPTDHAVQTIEVKAPFDQVLATIRDLDSTREWIPEILESEVLAVGEDHLPTTARFKAKATVGSDEYTLSYTHSDSTMGWTMLKGRLQTGQEGLYTLEAEGPDRTEVTYDLTIHHNLPLPGLIRSRVIKGLVASTLKGLKQRVE